MSLPQHTRSQRYPPMTTERRAMYAIRRLVQAVGDAGGPLGMLDGYSIRIPGETIVALKDAPRPAWAGMLIAALTTDLVMRGWLVSTTSQAGECITSISAPDDRYESESGRTLLITMLRVWLRVAA